MLLLFNHKRKIDKAFAFTSKADKVKQISNKFSSIEQFVELTRNCSALLLDDTKKLVLEQGHLTTLKKQREGSKATARSRKDLTERSNIFILDLEDTLHTNVKESDLLEFIDYLELPNYALYRSSSFYEKGITNKFHVFIQTDKCYSYSTLKNWLSFKSKDEHYLKGKHIYVDLSTFKIIPIFRHKLANPIRVINNGPLKNLNTFNNPHKRSVPIISHTPSKNRSILELSDTVITQEGEIVTVQYVQDILRDQKRYSSPTNNYANSKMQYFPTTRSFCDYSDNSKFYKIVEDTKIIRYSSTYAPLRSLTNTSINTVDISPTGSGKTYAYMIHTHTIFLVPTLALVNQLGKEYDQANPLISGFHTWRDINTSMCNVMTYDKLCGHLKEDLSEYNIIIDEAHLFISSINPQHLKLLKTLFYRKKKFKELKLLSATLLPETLSLFQFPHSIYRYIDINKKPKITFINDIPKLDKNKRTLFFLNSKQKIAVIADQHKEFNIFIAKSNAVIPSDFSNYNLILATQVLREGYSISNHIDTLIVHNVHNAKGAQDIAQFIARARGNTPDIYIVKALSHFKNSKYIPNLASLHNIVETSELPEDLNIFNKALNINRLMSLSKDDDNVTRLQGTIQYYNELQAMYENSNFSAMSNMLDYYSNAICFLDKIKNIYVPRKLDTDIKIRLKAIETKEELDLFLEYLQQINNETKEIYNKYSQRIVIDEITYKDKIRILKEKYQILSITDDIFREKLKQHQKNVVQGIYTLRDSIRNPYKINQVIRLSDAKRRFKVITKDFFKDINIENVISKLYQYQKLDDNKKPIKKWKRNQINKRIIITSLFLINNTILENEKKDIRIEGIN